ncbi:MAG: NADH-quinone oxidoreductase subunit N, partial [Archaeoglobales archaeon]
MVWLILALIILTISAAVSMKSRWTSFVLSILAIALSLTSGINAYTILIFFIAMLNIFSLLAIRENQIAGV